MLRWGVQRGDQVDEFAATGLNRNRWTENWAAPQPGNCGPVALPSARACSATD